MCATVEELTIKGFKCGEKVITSPMVDINGGRYVNPLTYYGDSYVEWNVNTKYEARNKLYMEYVMENTL